ncbi:MAG: hypothetical protein LBU79_02550, partial [Planctomycetota bacterium]|nr:hypothetical protein [Planctomycetota bacterium]
FAILLHFTITEAFAVYAGQNLGARCFDRIREGFWKVTGVLMVLCLISTVLVYFYGDSFVHLFITASDPNLESIVTISRGFLRVSSCLYPFLGLILIHNNTLRGIGDTLYPLISGLVELFAKGGLAIILGALFGYYGVWFAAPIGWVLGMIPPAIRYHRGGWEKMADRIDLQTLESVRFRAESSRFLLP